MQRHRHQEFIRFLNTIEAQVPVGKVIHAVVDNCSTHKHPKVRRSLARHPRWTFHFTPTSASWLNAVEGFFAKLTRQRLKRGVFQSVVDLQLAINRFVADTNADPKPFVWTADPKRVLAAVKRGNQALEAARSPSTALAVADGRCRLLCADGSHRNSVRICVGNRREIVPIKF
jgi:transposase